MDNKHARYKYIHILWHDDLKFNKNIVLMISGNPSRFDVGEHLFVTPFARVYDEIVKLTNGSVNAELYKQDDPYSAKLFNFYAPLCDIVFVHCIPSPHKSIFFKNKYCSKTVWRTWGGDTGYYYSSGDKLRNAAKHAVERLWKNKIKRFKAIGIANIADEIDIHARFGVMNTYRIPYTAPDGFENLRQAAESTRDEHDCLNIMIGHSGFATDNHRAIIKKFERFFDKNIHLYLVLSYGKDDYISSLEQTVNGKYAGKVTVIKDFLPYKEYIGLINKMDIAVLDRKISYALGNVSALLFLKKKIIVNREGIIKRAFDIEGVPHMCTDELDSVTFEALCEKPVYPEGFSSSLMPKEYGTCVNYWVDMLEDLSASERTKYRK